MFYPLTLLCLAYADQRLNLTKNLPNDDESIRGQLIGKYNWYMAR